MTIKYKSANCLRSPPINIEASKQVVYIGKEITEYRELIIYLT